MYHTKHRGVAHALVREHGAGSASVASERAEERFANIDVGGFAFWKRVERCIEAEAGTPQL